MRELSNSEEEEITSLIASAADKPKMLQLVDALCILRDHLERDFIKDQWFVRGNNEMIITASGDGSYRALIICNSKRKAAAVGRKLEAFGMVVKQYDNQLVATLSQLPNEDAATYLRSLLGFRKLKMKKPPKTTISKKRREIKKSIWKKPSASLKHLKAGYNSFKQGLWGVLSPPFLGWHLPTFYSIYKKRGTFEQIATKEAHTTNTVY